MIEKERLGYEIKRIRKSKKLTQEQIADNICNQSEISRIESGEYFPSVDVLYRLAHRLQLPVAYFFDIITHKEIKRTKEVKANIWRLSLRKNYNDIYTYTEKLLYSEEIFHPEIKKFLKWQMYLSAYYLKKIDLEYCRAELKLLLKQKVEGTDILLNLHIKNSIANILAENEKFKESALLYKSILSSLSNSQEGDKLEVKVSYNYGKQLYEKGSLNQAMVLTDEGIALSCRIHDMSLLGQLFYQKGSLMEKLQYPYSEIASYYQKAEVIFELLQLDLHLEILVKHKSEFLNNIPPYK